jgi:uncharacterized LabA/DUF88 family protein
MRTIIYVDSFNLYFRMLKQRPAFKWLDLRALCTRILNVENQIIAIKYYTARVSGRLDSGAPSRQQLYLDALGTLPELSVYLGTFLITEKFAGFGKPPEFRPRIEMPEPWPDVVKIIKVEEKGSDVNLASHLVFDACRNAFDVAAVLSADTDLIEPIRIVTQELGKPVGILSPVGNPSKGLRAVASFVRNIVAGDLAASQFPNPIVFEDGTMLHKPPTWV